LFIDSVKIDDSKVELLAVLSDFQTSLKD